ncbi:hypothetical protein MNBD_NITROSPINAE04-1125 [hydrothermal vent metagenome]|uniref:Cds6 C-terminal domain-containing protein n=1 Tax=hydrothermal vent metagenome TaxID=652676 RepID=A0A3B1BVT7_9ZZZZ
MKTILTFVLSLLIFVVFLPSAAFATDLSAVIEMADSGDVDGAIKKLDEMLKQDEGNIQVRFFKATLLMEAGRANEAQAVLEDVTRRYPDLPEAYNNLAALHASQGRLIQAKTMLENLTISHPNFAIAHENLSDIYAALASQGMERAARLGARSETSRRKLELLEEIVEFVPLEDETKNAKEVKKASYKKAESKKIKVKTSTSPKQAEKAQPVAKPKPVEKVVVAAVETRKEEKVAAPPIEPAEPKLVEKPKPAAKSTRQVIVDFVNSWRRAWISKDIKKYSAHYTDDFKYKGIEKAVWMKKKLARFKKSGAIDMKVSDVKVVFGAGEAVVTFTQRYKSNVINSVGKKRLKLVNTDDGWKIASEKWSPK